jgi:hypothetical protein
MEEVMAETTEVRRTLGENAATQLANVTKTHAQWEGITPRWLVPFLQWVPVESGIFRLNKVKDKANGPDVECSPRGDADLPQTLVNYDEFPKELWLNAVTSVLHVQTRVSDLYSKPIDQIQEQLRLLIERVKERQEGELINNKEYGLLQSAVDSQKIKTRQGRPTPDDLDELITKVWKEPSFFLAHPKAVAAFGRECTRRGVPPPTATLFGSPFLTWRGIPIVSSDKVKIDEKNKTNILLVRTGEKKQGVIGLFQPGLPGEVSPSLSVRFMGIDSKAIASYLISLYCSLAVLTDDAVAVLEDVDVAQYYDYK